jgi:hypothetical protein
MNITGRYYQYSNKVSTRFVSFFLNSVFVSSSSSTYNSVLWNINRVCLSLVRSVLILYLLLNPSSIYVRHCAINELNAGSIWYKCLLLLNIYTCVCVYIFIQIVCLLNEICVCVRLMKFYDLCFFLSFFCLDINEI